MSIQATARRRWLQASLGISAVAVSLGGTVLAAALSPWFSPFRNALSDLGAAGRAVAPLFNGGLLVGGALGAGFVVAVWDDTDDPVRRGALVLLFMAMVAMALVGAFPLPALLHFVVAPLFFFLTTLGVFIWGAGDFAVGRSDRGAVLVLASATHVAAWLWWGLLGWPGPGIAVPELVGSAGLSAWALWLSLDRWPDPIEPDRL